ncbi:hypothetical protein [Thermaurantiacus tibetensis]|uniref:hypothetical protein n=1 Tax=Thermaurantiacus tibetensis TaxID=2759035 RepID=UPI001890A9A1|nr:hypothetical protein [Thermaurantiacus tibetensis]
MSLPFASDLPYGREHDAGPPLLPATRLTAARMVARGGRAAGGRPGEALNQEGPRG